MKLSSLEAGSYFVYQTSMYQLESHGSNCCKVINFAGIRLELDNDTEVEMIKTVSPCPEDGA